MDVEGLFALGSNGSGQLGIGHREDVSVPKPALFRYELTHGHLGVDYIIRVAAGGNHTILMNRVGTAYWSGDPSNGCCGITTGYTDTGGNGFREMCLSKTDEVGMAHFIACMWDSTVVVTADEMNGSTRVYTCGGTPSESGESAPPTLIPNFPPAGTEIINIAAGFRHVVTVLDNGDVYGWGNGRKGQLGEGKTIVDSPSKITDVPFKVADVACCQHATCLIAEPGDGRIMVLGADKWGLKSNAPAEIPSWETIAAGWGTIYVLKRDGSLIGWGRDDHGQLPPPGLPELLHVVAGSEHVVALTPTGDVLTWGWGEHGNCGPDVDEKSGDVKGRWNVLASVKNLREGSSVTAIGAGCATTWLYIAQEHNPLGLFL